MQNRLRRIFAFKRKSVSLTALEAEHVARVLVNPCKIAWDEFLFLIVYPQGQPHLTMLATRQNSKFTYAKQLLSTPASHNYAIAILKKFVPLLQSKNSGHLLHTWRMRTIVLHWLTIVWPRRRGQKNNGSRPRRRESPATSVSSAQAWCRQSVSHSDPYIGKERQLQIFAQAHIVSEFFILTSSLFSSCVGARMLLFQYERISSHLYK